MAISFKPLRVLLAERDIRKMDFIRALGVSSRTAAKLWRDEHVSLDVIDKICTLLDCEIQDVMRHVKEENRHDQSGRSSAKIHA